MQFSTNRLSRGLRRLGIARVFCGFPNSHVKRLRKKERARTTYVACQDIKFATDLDTSKVGHGEPYAPDRAGFIGLRLKVSDFIS